MTERWAEWLRLAHRVLRLNPDAFWALSLLEWRVLIQGESRAGTVMTRKELDALLAANPDFAALRKET